MNKNTKRRLFHNHNHTCVYCGMQLSHSDTWTSPTVEHVEPKKNGGSNRVHNLLSACRYCNQYKDFAERSLMLDPIPTAVWTRFRQAHPERILDRLEAHNLFLWYLLMTPSDMAQINARVGRLHPHRIMNNLIEGCLE